MTTGVVAGLVVGFCMGVVVCLWVVAFYVIRQIGW